MAGCTPGFDAAISPGAAIVAPVASTNSRLRMLALPPSHGLGRDGTSGVVDPIKERIKTIVNAIFSTWVTAANNA
jgi:hypothetical protein